MRIDKDSLKSNLNALLISLGESEENAETVSRYMTMCDARGVTTHGSYMINPVCDRREAGMMELPTRLDIVIDSGAVCVIDGNDGLGQAAADKACEIACAKAGEYGISAVLLRNTNNVGALGPYTEKIAARGMIALMCCNASPAMAPWGGREQFTGTQPFAIGVYTGEEPAFSADMATAAVARGKIRQAMREGKTIPETWALDVEGRPTTDPAEAIRGILLPIGGPKGSAMALAIDIAAGMLSGSAYAPNVKAIHYPEGKAGVGGCIIAIDIAHFMDLEEFRTKMQEYLASIRSMKKAEGVTRIYIPGEIEYEKTVNSYANGINLTDTAVEQLNRKFEKYGIPALIPVE
ncbi:MAG: Ldh family oxidoreductase [Solobacterium sp.]|nr:Ldh family oxidoreductase [Solobacterium sp.]